MKQIKAKFEEIIDLRNKKMLELSEAEDLTHEMYDSIKELESENTPESGIILEMMYDKYADQYEKMESLREEHRALEEIKDHLIQIMLIMEDYNF